MKTKLVAANTVTLLAIAAVLLHGQGTGPLDPSAAPADGVYRTLDEIYAAVQASAANAEARTPISSAPFAINEPGSYYLTGNLVASPTRFEAAVGINASNVTLDLNGFTISSTPEARGYGISASGFYSNVTVRNGFIEGNTTVSIDPLLRTWTYDKAGFGTGIYGATHVENVSIRGCRGRGIVAEHHGGTVINCAINSCGGRAIDMFREGIVRDCRMSGNGYGVFGPNTVVTNCLAFQNEDQGFLAAVISNCSVIDNGMFGAGGPVVVACHAKGNQNGLIGSVISQCHAADNLGWGLWTGGGGGTATSLSSASGNGAGQILANTYTGNYPQ